MIAKRVIDECYKRHILFESCEGCPYQGKQCQRVSEIVRVNGNFINVDKRIIRPSDYITR